MISLGFVGASKEVTHPWLSAGVTAGQQRERAVLAGGGVGDRLGRSCGSSFVCFVSMITAGAKMDKAKDFSCGPVLGRPSPRDVGAADREVPRLLARGWGNGVLYCFFPLSAWDCGQRRDFRLVGLKAGNVQLCFCNCRK